jgi:N-acetylglutamate synthase-like GNAT family acetyltransferase
MNIRPAHPQDVPQILALLNEHVRRGDLLPRTALSIRDTLGDWLVGVHADGDLVACVSLFYYTPYLAEVRSLAVSDRVKGQGWGSSIVRALIHEARQRQVPTLFALTRAVDFFQKVGFKITVKERFPQKVFRDCSFVRCWRRVMKRPLSSNSAPPSPPTITSSP